MLYDRHQLFRKLDGLTAKGVRGGAVIMREDVGKQSRHGGRECRQIPAPA